jgi:hypothetical protein
LWLPRGEVARLTGLTEGQVQAALCRLAVDGFVERGLSDDGRVLTVIWMARFPERTRDRGAAAVATEAAE